MNQHEYLDKRVSDQINWMEMKSKKAQQRYKGLKLTEIIAAALIPTVAGIPPLHPYLPVITGCLGFLIVVINGLQQLQRYHENWLAYRSSSEALKRERILFEAGTSPYKGDEAYEKFVQNFEALLADENKIWKSTMSRNAPATTQ
jgi:hypothetical protein